MAVEHLTKITEEKTEYSRGKRMLSCRKEANLTERNETKLCRKV